MNEKLHLKEAVIVEGRYDRIRLSELIASPIIETGGFRVFKDKEKQNLIRSIAERRGILVMTDVDSAGFVIRNFLRGIIPVDQIKHAYIPTVEGKERRKPQPSKEGVLGVEGIDRDALLRSIRLSGATVIGESVGKSGEITKADFYDYGLTGRENSAVLREAILSDLGLPRYLSTNAMVAALNCLFSKEEFLNYLSDKK
jgi:ribonuclease M5